MKKFSQRALLACLLAALLAVPAGTALWGSRNTTAYYENRALAERPALTWAALWDGSYGSALERWYTDHAPARTTLLRADAAAQMRLLRRPAVNGIVEAGEVLVPFQDYGGQSRAEYAAAAPEIADRYGKLNEHIAALGGAFYFAGFPEQRVYFQEAFPAYLNSRRDETAAADDVFREALADRGVRFLDMGAVYDGLGHPADLYSAVDHHYSYYGAYAAYRAILDALAADGWDLPVLTEDDIDLVPQPNPYIGSRNRKLYNLWPNGEQAAIGVQRSPVAYARWDNGTRTDRPLFVLPEDPAMPTTYNLYMGGDFGETILRTDRPDLPDALIFGDSFTNALETLLYASFDETRVLDLRHYTDKTLRDYISEYQPDLVLCVQNDTFYYTASGSGGVWPED